MLARLFARLLAHVTPRLAARSSRFAVRLWTRWVWGTCGAHYEPTTTGMMKFVAAEEAQFTASVASLFQNALSTASEFPVVQDARAASRSRRAALLDGMRLGSRVRVRSGGGKSQYSLSIVRISQ